MFVNFASEYLTQLFYGLGKTLAFKIATLFAENRDALTLAHTLVIIVKLLAGVT